MLVDSHCHLDFPDFEPELDDVVTRAHDAGVTVMQTICTRISQFEDVHAIAARYPHIYCSVGVHPHHVEEEGVFPASEIVNHTESDQVIGIGETGLDYYYDNSPRALQCESFRQHIEAARTTGLPLIVHTRAADDDTMDILEDEMRKGPFNGLIHCFSTSRELAMRSLDIGMLISISGIATFRKAEELRDTIREIPLEMLLVETDAPFLAPVPRRGKRNEPSYVVHTAEMVASIKNVSFDTLAATTTDNFFRLFTRADRPEQ